MISGYLAFFTFLIFTGVGSLAQVHKLWSRTKQWKNGALERAHIYDGLRATREMWSLAAFLLFALSGATRSYFDIVLVVSRTPVVILSTVTLWYLSHHGAPRAHGFFKLALLGNVFFLLVVFARALNLDVSSTVLPYLIDLTLSGVSLGLLYGKLSQAHLMRKEQKSGAVSSLREAGLLLKDVTGMWYAYQIGSELFWIFLTHVFSLIGSTAILFAKGTVESNANLHH